ncbi:MAG TPA: GNAT family N-acetyltransferase [Candidatus Limnocylindrales bacterium]|nr:GNAT family N-acetyltransferase [Candidatus Limnocylindrales bacterium]
MTAAPERRTVVVRRARPDDGPAIREIGHAAWRQTYVALIGEAAVEAFLAKAYTPERVALRIERHDTFVAGFDGGDQSGVDAFVQALHEDDHAHIAAFYTRPDARGQGLGTALLARVVATYPLLDISADVLVGNALGEPFYVARGFEPAQLLDEDLGGVTIRERRWWLRADRG